MVKNKRTAHVVWSSDIGNLSDWKDFLDDAGLTHASDDAKYVAISEMNAEYLNDERANLNLIVQNGILAVASCGSWNGRQMHCMNIGNNLSNCLNFATTGVSSNGEHCWYVDRYGNFCCRAIHHDGMNTITYREWKPNVSDTQKANLMEKIHNNARKTS